jgi:hypothetical protein
MFRVQEFDLVRKAAVTWKDEIIRTARDEDLKLVKILAQYPEVGKVTMWDCAYHNSD